MPPASRLAAAISSYTVETEGNPFAELSAATSWEAVGKGRRGAVLTRTDEAGGVPLVRTTTRYGSPAQRFRAVHERLARQVQERAGLPAGFNNALVESYTNAYRTMGSHSDQALDLADGSSIAVFSCYRRGGEGPSRKLVFEAKASPGGGEGFEIPLAHNSVVVFSVESNRRLRHKIVLDGPAPAEDDEWLGVTFRTSKTLLRFRDGQAHLPGGELLVRADEDQSREFYRLRRRENQETDFVYPPLTYTISESDLLPPV
ncbi:alpha-ketoglutarate-dependent dioxygenase AlkB [Streptomyces sp. NPDC127069]|uniref:alpha-ketoglutarate-dependent dioxygenase AlkB n=1 Tax=Streptomyces sp. NPDC127069 TaxID=3347128 RepID=UPI00365D65CA